MATPYTPPPSYYLQHKRENRVIHCRDYQQALSDFYRQWRDPDGSIPWTIEYGVI